MQPYKPVMPPAEWNPTVAEDLIEVADLILRPRHTVVEIEAQGDPLFVAFLVLAVKLDRAPAAVKFRAIYERWNQRRITQELY